MDTKPKSTPGISEKFIDQLYSIETRFTDENGNPVEIPDSGFLGLLATGYKGLAMLRKKKGQTHLYKKFTKGKKLMKRNQGKSGKNNPERIST